MTKSADNNYQVPALLRGLRILELFGTEHRILNTHDFAEALGVTTSSIYRVIQTLTDQRYLKKVARNTYELGPAAISLGFSYLASRDLSDVAASHLNRLRDSTSISCHLAIRDDRDALYIYRALASQRLSVNVPVGTRLPCHTTALGRALLMDMSDDELGRLYFGTCLDGYTKQNPQNLPELRRKLKEERRQGYSISRSDFATAIAMPLRDYSQQVVAAINISAPDVIMQNKTVAQEAIEHLQNTSEAICKELGG